MTSAGKLIKIERNYAYHIVEDQFEKVCDSWKEGLKYIFRHREIHRSSDIYR